MTNEKLYEDIIHLPHHVSQVRPQMAMSERAAQFSPFAALTGYDAAIQETGRLTDTKVELDEEALRDLDLKFQLLYEKRGQEPWVTITYFEPDKAKAGGAYLVATDKIKKVDPQERIILTARGVPIPMDNVVSLESDLLRTVFD